MFKGMGTEYAIVQHPNRGILFGPYGERWQVEEEVREYLTAQSAARMDRVSKAEVTYFTAQFTVVGRHGGDWYHSEIVQRRS